MKELRFIIAFMTALFVLNVIFFIRDLSAGVTTYRASRAVRVLLNRKNNPEKYNEGIRQNFLYIGIIGFGGGIFFMIYKLVDE